MSTIINPHHTNHIAMYLNGFWGLTLTFGFHNLRFSFFFLTVTVWLSGIASEPDSNNNTEKAKHLILSEMLHKNKSAMFKKTSRPKWPIILIIKRILLSESSHTAVFTELWIFPKGTLHSLTLAMCGSFFLSSFLMGKRKHRVFCTVKFYFY